MTNHQDTVTNRLHALTEALQAIDHHQVDLLAPAFLFDASSLDQPPGEVLASFGPWRPPSTERSTAISLAGAQPQVIANDPFAMLSASQLQRGYAEGQFSVTDVVTSALDRIETLSPSLKAFTKIFHSAASQAGHFDKEIKDGKPKPPLFGVPVGIKDVIDIEGHATTGGSRAFKNNLAKRHAEVTRRLIANGAIVVGKLGTHELAFGGTSDTPFHGPIRNPWNPEHVAGGSSGGAGSAVAARLVPIAIGSDSGGSVRIPAAACGVYGFKPSYDSISRQGVLPLAWSLDHVGLLAATMEDIHLTLAVLTDGIAGAPNEALSLVGQRIGIPTGWIQRETVQRDVIEHFDEAVKHLQGLGADVVEVPAQGLPELGHLLLANRVIIMAEAAAKYGYLLDRSDTELHEEVRVRLEIGRRIQATEYLTAQRLRSLVTVAVERCLRNLDALALPTLPLTAPRIGQSEWSMPNGESEAIGSALVRFTAPFNITGQPALAFPVGLAGDGLPVSLQLVGRYRGDAEILRIGRALSAAVSSRPHP